jgi:ribokinase
MARLLVVGSSNTDVTVRLPRLPSAGETVLGGVLAQGPGGKGANQAVAAARAGAEVTFVACVGDDDYGRAAIDHYRSERIDVSHVAIRAGTASGVALIFVGEEQGGENLIGVASGANATLSASDVDALPARLFHEADALLVAGLEIPIDAVARAATRAKAAGKLVVMNPAPVHAGLVASGVLPLVDVVTPNLGELLALTGSSGEDPLAVAAAASRLRRMGPGRVCATLGARGAFLSAGPDAPGAAPEHVEPFAVEVVDTVGAGDCFSAALAVALAENHPFSEAARWACAAAALAVTRRGAQGALPRREAIDRLAATRAVGKGASS